MKFSGNSRGFGVVSGGHVDKPVAVEAPCKDCGESTPILLDLTTCHGCKKVVCWECSTSGTTEMAGIINFVKVCKKCVAEKVLTED